MESTGPTGNVYSIWTTDNGIQRHRDHGPQGRKPMENGCGKHWHNGGGKLWKTEGGKHRDNGGVKHGKKRESEAQGQWKREHRNNRGRKHRENG